jgi:hypothetical protein
MQHDPFDQVVRGVREDDQIRMRADSCAIEEFIAKGTGGGLDGSLRHRNVAPLTDQRNADASAELADLPRDLLRPVAERVVVMRRHNFVPALMKCQQHGG